MKITFTHLGTERTLAKHSRVTRELKAGQITESEAKSKPWYLRLQINGTERVFRLSCTEKQAIADAKDILSGRVKQPETFSTFIAARESRLGSTCGELAALWIAAGLPFTTAKPRKPEAAKTMASTITRALAWWRDKRWSAVNPHMLEEFVVWRRQNVRACSFSGNRSADLELAALSSLGHWALASNQVETNPFASRTRFVDPENITHCHEGMPDNDQQLHQLLASFFSDPANKGRVVAGAYLAFMALTGLRPGEPIYTLRVPPADKYPANFEAAPVGLIYPMPDGTRRLKVQRLKRGQNPAVLYHPALASFMSAYNLWLSVAFPLVETGPLFPCLPANTHIYLADACTAAGIHTMKPHGFGRAYYVRVRRSMGLDDAAIACELGQSTNGALIRSVYGHPKDPVGGMLHDWLPADEKGHPVPPAWANIAPNPEILPCP